MLPPKGDQGCVKTASLVGLDVLSGENSLVSSDPREVVKRPVGWPTLTTTIPSAPYERPRQSVANLIGRFEKQKSSSGPAALPPAFPRTSSVSSHRTEDSAQEEIKERREWPPKSVQTSATLTLPEPVLGKPSPPSSSTLPVEKDPETPPESVLPSPPAEVHPPPSLPVISTEAMPPKARSPPPSAKPVSTRLASSVKSPAPKPTVKPSTATPLKSTASGGSTSSTPLKPQDTGQSTMSTGSAAKTPAKRVPATPKPPVATTPSRVKTPLSTTRAKTPSSEIRPKTPSSGLYAPTAASLARSRTADGGFRIQDANPCCDAC
ncbi:hypothetical protein JB92DRAFT_610026 [Gautieria morchelliformis]|nr:hypothetical protein JB92DRAFT_610026 [Gautieria morchelliformis]